MLILALFGALAAVGSCTPVFTIDAARTDPSSCSAPPIRGDAVGGCVCFAVVTGDQLASSAQFAYGNATFEVPLAHIDGASHACVLCPDGTVGMRILTGETWSDPLTVNVPGQTSFLPMSLIVAPFAPIIYEPPPAVPVVHAAGKNRVITHRKLISRYDARCPHSMYSLLTSPHLAGYTKRTTHTQRPQLRSRHRSRLVHCIF